MKTVLNLTQNMPIRQVMISPGSVKAHNGAPRLWDWFISMTVNCQKMTPAGWILHGLRPGSVAMTTTQRGLVWCYWWRSC